MKKTILLTAICITSSIGAFAQNVNIPDANFKAYLVGNSSINTNMDTEIQMSEATAFSGGIYCGNLSISNLSGIESFTNLTILRCPDNTITTLDISNNTSLIELNCTNNALSTLNLTNNTDLTQLRCGHNSLTSLDVSNNPYLTFLDCGSNPITSIDLSNNPLLTFFGCNYNNTLMTLDVSNNPVLSSIYCNDTPISVLNVANGNNTNFTTFVATNTPNLTCIQVDDVNYSTANWTSIDATASFSLDCNFGLGLIEGNISEELTLFPNPTTSQLTIQTEDKLISATIIDGTGRSLDVNLSNDNIIDVSKLSSGIYQLQIETDKGFAIKKFIKE